MFIKKSENIFNDPLHRRIKQWVQGIIRNIGCEGCGYLHAKWHRLDTFYSDEMSNWMFVCPKCREEYDARVQDMWDEYYSSQGFQPCPEKS